MRRKNKKLAITIPEDVYREFKLICKNMDISMSKLIRRLINDWIISEKRRPNSSKW